MGVGLEALQQPFQGRRGEGQLQIKAVDQLDPLAPACIHTALHHPMAAQHGSRLAQPAQDRGLEIVGAVIEGQLQFAEAQGFCQNAAGRWGGWLLRPLSPV